MKKLIITIFYLICFLFPASTLAADLKPCSVVVPMTIQDMINRRPSEPHLRPYREWNKRLDDFSPNAEHFLYHHVTRMDRGWFSMAILALAVTTDPAIPLTTSMAPISAITKEGFAAFHLASNEQCILKNGHAAVIYVATQSFDKKKRKRNHYHDSSTH